MLELLATATQDGAHHLAAWLLTYALHSTLLLGLAWLAVRLLRGRLLWLEDRLWKGALVGGLVTASLPIGDPGRAPPEPAPLPPPVVRVERAARAPVPRGVDMPPLVLGRAPRTRAQAPVVLVDDAPSAGAPVAAVRIDAPLAAAPEAPERHATMHLELPRFGWTPLVCGLWLLVALVQLGRLGRSWWRLHRLLSGRIPVRNARLLALVDELGRAARLPGPVRLTGSPHLPVPIAKGLWHLEICLPLRVLTDLPLDEQRSILAHELGHLERRDPAWLLLGQIVGSVFFFQPLNLLARRRLQELSEYFCDDWSADQTGRPLVLARCLTEVAGWLLDDEQAQPVPGMLQTGSELGRRVRRLLAWEKRSRSMPKPVYVISFGAAMLVGMSLCVPHFVLPRAEARKRPAAEAPGAPAPPAPPAPPAGAPTPPTPPTPPSPRVAGRRPPEVRVAPIGVPAPQVEIDDDDDDDDDDDREELDSLKDELRQAVKETVPTPEQRAQITAKARELAEAVRRGDQARQAELSREIEKLAQRAGSPELWDKVGRLQAKIAERASRIAQRHMAKFAHRAQRAHDDDDDDGHAGAAVAADDDDDDDDDDNGPGSDDFREQVREAVREAMQQAREAIQQSREATREAVRQAREAIRAHREAEKAAADAQDDVDEAVDDAEEAQDHGARAELESARRQLEAERQKLAAERQKLEAERRALREELRRARPRTTP